MVVMIESQLEYVLDCLRVLDERGARVCEVKKEAVEHYNEVLDRQMPGTGWTAARCQSWYLDETGRNSTLWPSFSYAFRRRTERFDPEAYEVSA